MALAVVNLESDEYRINVPLKSSSCLGLHIFFEALDPILAVASIRFVTPDYIVVIFPAILASPGNWPNLMAGVTWLFILPWTWSSLSQRSVRLNALKKTSL